MSSALASGLPEPEGLIPQEVGTVVLENMMVELEQAEEEARSTGENEGEEALPAEHGADAGMDGYEDVEWDDDVVACVAPSASVVKAEVEAEVAAVSPIKAASGAAMAAAVSGVQASCESGDHGKLAEAVAGKEVAALEEEQGGHMTEVLRAREQAAAEATWLETSASVEAPFAWAGLDGVWLQIADEISCRADVTRQVNVEGKQVAAVVGHEHEQRVVVPFFLFSSSPEVNSAFPAAPPHSLRVHVAVMLPWPFVSAGGQGIGPAPRWVFHAMLVHPALQAWH